MYKNYIIKKDNGDAVIEGIDGEAVLKEKLYHPDTRQFLGQTTQPVTIEYLKGIEKDLVSDLENVREMLSDVSLYEQPIDESE